MITEEDEKYIKEIAQDINEKAFYGKILSKLKKESSKRENKENEGNQELN